MDPLTLGIGAIGLGMSLYGKFKGSADASQYSALEKQQAGLEMQINQQKQQQMALNGRRQQLEVFRNTQRLKAQSVQAGVNQGAQFGSGLAGGMAQVTAQGNYNLLNIDQNLQVGKNIFGLNDQISGVKMQMAGVKSNLATDQGWTSMGGAVLSSADKIGNLAGNLNFGGANAGFSYDNIPMAGKDFA